MRGGAYGPRAKINKHLFIECGVLRGGGRLLPAKIGTGKDIIFIDSWDPENNADSVDHGHSIKANVHVDTALEYERNWASGDYDGVHDNTKAVGDGISLETAGAGTDFEDYDLGALVGQTEEWISRAVYSGANVADALGTRLAQFQQYNQELVYTYDEAGLAINGGTITIKTRKDYGTGQWGVGWDLTGAGSALRGYTAQFNVDSVWFQLKRVNSHSYWFGINSINLGWTPSYDVWYWVKIKWENTGTQMNSWFKIWADGDAEPGSFTWLGSDSAYDNPGAVGIMCNCGLTTPLYYVDDVTIEPAPSTYWPSGTFVFDPASMVDCAAYSHLLAEWDETAPTDTAVVVSYRWRDIDSWIPIASGDRVAGPSLGANMLVGSTYDTLYLKAEFTTSEPTATALIENLRLYHDPLAFGAVGIDINGDHSCTPTNGLLDWWGKSQISAGVPFSAWDDIWLQTDGPRWVYSPGAGIAVSLNYWGNTIGNIALNVAQDQWMEAMDKAGWYWGMTPLAYDSPPVQIRWNPQAAWTPAGHIYEWVLIDAGIAIHADVDWICGRSVLNDHPLSFLVAVPNITDHPLSVQVRGWRRDDHPLSMLVQGWRRDDHPISFLPGIWEFVDHPISVLPATVHISDQPMSFQVFGVNRESMIEVNIIDYDTWLEMAALGYTRT
jgi:hypothetical protein